MPYEMPESDRLYRECIQAVGRLYRHRLNRKLLRVALDALQRVEGYKSDRKFRDATPPDEG